MNDEQINEAVGSITESFSDSGFPPEFLSRFEICECLNQTRSNDTLLVRDKSTELLYIAKCYGSGELSMPKAESSILRSLRHDALPLFEGEYGTDGMKIIVREYAPGVSLDTYKEQKGLSRDEILSVCVQLCDILIYLHTHEPPVIHRDIKPQNIIIGEDGRIKLIDFDASRLYDRAGTKDTVYMGTKEYAPPEQFGYTQTDGRSDIYSMGVLICYLLTGGTDIAQSLPQIKDKGLKKIILKCTAFDPKRRYSDAAAVKKAIKAQYPRAKTARALTVAAICVAAAALLAIGAYKIYEAATYSVFSEEGYETQYVTSENTIDDAVAYLNAKYDTDIFVNSEEDGNIGYMRKILVEVYGLDRDYVYANLHGGEMPTEWDDQFYPWGFEDVQSNEQVLTAYTIVKLFWPEEIADYTRLKDDNGVFPGVRLAEMFCEEHGLLDGIARPYNVTKGEVTIAFANAERLRETQGN